MVKNHTDVTVPIHGGLYHSTYIFLAMYICAKRGYTLKNPESFSMMYKTPGIPDVYVEYKYKGKNEYDKTIDIKTSVCIEIETNMTKNACVKKAEQFTRSGMHEPIIIDMNRGFAKFKKDNISRGVNYDNDIEWAYQYIDYCIVL